MRILVDGDAFPDLGSIVTLAKKYNIKVIIYVDSEHEINLDTTIIRVAKGANAVDTKLENDVLEGDIVLTQDYGVAVICLSKNAIVINQLGYLYNSDKIDFMMEIRSQNRKMRKHIHIKGPKKRTKLDTKRLLEQIEELINK